MAPSRTVGLPIHLLYPILSAILLGVAAFPTAGSVWYVSAQTNILAVSPLPPSSHLNLTHGTVIHSTLVLTIVPGPLCFTGLVSPPSPGLTLHSPIFRKWGGGSGNSLETSAKLMGAYCSCGYNVTSLAITTKVGCIYRGWEWQIPDRYFGFPLPDEINISLSRVAIMT